MSNSCYTRAVIGLLAVAIVTESFNHDHFPQYHLPEIPAEIRLPMLPTMPASGSFYLQAPGSSGIVCFPQAPAVWNGANYASV